MAAVVVRESSAAGPAAGAGSGPNGRKPDSQWRRRWQRFWHRYTSMRVAIYFLSAIVGIVVIGTLVPQQDTSLQSKVDAFLAAHHNLNAVTTWLGLPLTQVYVSPLFFLLLGSLYIALGACVLRRGRALWFRTRKGHRKTPQYWGEIGSWMFHTAFFVLLVAAVWGKATGYEGLVSVTEGQSFSEARASFDTLQEGILFNGHHSDTTVTLNRFNVQYDAAGTAVKYDSNLTFAGAGSPALTRDIQVNSYATYNGVSFYQQDFGWAPEIVVRNPAGKVVFDGNVQFFGEQKNVQTGVLKVPGFGYTIPGASQPVQLGAKMAIFPDARTIAAVNSAGAIVPGETNYGPGGVQARNPVLQLQLFVGDLGLDSGKPQDVTALDTGNMQPYFSDSRPVPLLLGNSISLPLPAANGGQSNFTISFPKLRQYTVLLIKKDVGVPLIYLGFALLLGGLITKLYVRPLLERRQNISPGYTDHLATMSKRRDATSRWVGAGQLRDQKVPGDENE